MLNLSVPEGDAGEGLRDLLNRLVKSPRAASPRFSTSPFKCATAASTNPCSNGPARRSSPAWTAASTHSLSDPSGPGAQRAYGDPRRVPAAAGFSGRRSVREFFIVEVRATLLEMLTRRYYRMRSRHGESGPGGGLRRRVLPSRSTNSRGSRSHVFAIYTPRRTSPRP